MQNFEMSESMTQTKVDNEDVSPDTTYLKGFSPLGNSPVAQNKLNLQNFNVYQSLS